MFAYGIGEGGGLLQEKKKEKYKGSLLLKFAVFCLAVFAVVILAGRQMEIAQKRRELADLQNQLDQQAVRNAELSDSLEDSSGLEEYAEKKARRDLDYAKPNERIFVDVGGGD